MSLREVGLTQVSEFTKDEALAFIEAIRLNLDGKVGFKWFVERLTHLADYIESVAVENERLNAYLDWAKARDDYESYCAITDDRPDREPRT
ncbi:MAG: hypothetical protein Q8K99_00855 [Actinomycetota bacterium]|nr:hypothetical protein [Actinomycetota bacterium]